MFAVALKRLTPTEVTWLGGRGAGGADARGPLLDDALVGAWLDPDGDAVEVRARWHDGHRVREDHRPLLRGAGAWQLGGGRLGGRRLARARPNDLAVMVLDHTVDVGGDQRGLVTLDVLDRHREADALEVAIGLLGPRASVWLEGRDAVRWLGLAAQVLPAFGGGPAWDVEGLSERDWADLRAWLGRHVRTPALRELLEGSSHQLTREVLGALGDAPVPPNRGALAEAVIRRYGTELLATPERRRLLADERAHTGLRTTPPHAWVRGTSAARRWVERLGLPPSLAGQPMPPEANFEDLSPFPPVGPLHDYQKQLAARLGEVLHASRWQDRRAVVWLPTGTGKTRVTVETLLLECFLAPPTSCVLWVADRAELCEQAIATFRHVWMVRGWQTPSARGLSTPTLRVVRLWGGRPWQDPPPFPTLVVASIQTLARRVQQRDFALRLAELGARCAAVVFDEAHHVVAPTYARVLRALGLSPRPNVLGRTWTTGPPLLGLTATPSRTRHDETERLAAAFRGRLLEPDAPYDALGGFVRRGFVARPRLVVVPTGHVLTRLDALEEEHWRRYRDLPRGTVRRAGADPARTAAIVADLERRLPDLVSVLVFACSVEHAETLADVLTRRGHPAKAIHGGSPRSVRQGVIRRFRERAVKVLVTCELLATGFDAPNVDAVVLARPVGSRVLFAQMVGRGLRGPKNGGTPQCLVLDYEDSLGAFRDLDALRLAFRAAFTEGASSDVGPEPDGPEPAPT